MNPIDVQVSQCFKNTLELHNDFLPPHISLFGYRIHLHSIKETATFEKPMELGLYVSSWTSLVEGDEQLDRPNGQTCKE